MAARDAILGVVPDAQVVLIPCADGGEGTMEALSPAHSQRVSVEVCGPLPDMRVNAAYTISHGTAVIEMAAASGLALLADSQRDVMHATTRGTGMLIRHAIAHGAQRVTLGIGGSATNDCGMGILSALGFRFLDQQGRELAPCGANLAKVARVDADAVPQQVFNTRFDVITDVDNPLCGTHGAAAVYAPQKGASAQQVTLLDEGARHFSQFMPDGVAEAPGAGAAGGVGAGLKAFLNAILHPGADAVLRFLKVDEAIADADLVMTGEGKWTLPPPTANFPTLWLGSAASAPCQPWHCAVFSKAKPLACLPRCFASILCLWICHWRLTLKYASHEWHQQPKN